MEPPTKPMDHPTKPARILKETVRERFNNYQVNAVHFTALSGDEIAKSAAMEVLNSNEYDQRTRIPHVFGPLDERMGVCNKSRVCATCSQSLETCMGHFGYVRLVLPVFHCGYFKYTQHVLQCICKICARLLMPPEEINRSVARLRRLSEDPIQRTALYKKLVESTRNNKRCPHCNAENAMLKKGGTGVPLLFKHMIGVQKNITHPDLCSQFLESFTDTSNNNKDISDHKDKAQEDVNPLVAHQLLQKMVPQDREVLGILQPERMIITALPVPPVCVRPSVVMGDAGTREDDLTDAIRDILEANSMLKEHLERGGQPRQVLEAWQYLQEKCAVYVNSDVSGLQLPKREMTRPIRSICSRLKGKEGRFRGHLNGKRVDFSGRTVISPDPNVSVEEVVVPEWTAKRMTFPEKVCKANLARLQEAVRRGPEEWPGACFTKSVDGRGKYLGALRKNFRRQIAENLRYGDTVERHMRDGDIVLFNRQPSLHRLSIMAHRAKVMFGRTFRFNECVCAPYNADFDGDEMNLHLPQTEEARAEAYQLMGVRDGLVTPKSGEVAICATQDFLTGSFLLTQRDVFLSRDKFCQLCCYVTDGMEKIDLPPPAILKPVELWTGKQVFNVMLRPNRRSKVVVNFEAPEANYTKSGETMCKNDGWVCFRNSELISGNLGKKVLGSSKNGLFFRLIRDSGTASAIGCMNRLAKLTSRWLQNRGFTIGIDDVNARYGHTIDGPRSGVDVTEAKRRITEEKYNVVTGYIRRFNEGTLELKSGCDADQTLEAIVNGELGQIRNLVGDTCKDGLTFYNKPRIMAQCGSKGSSINLCQMMACVGQQNVGGKRIQDGFVKRTLPHFAKGSKEPMARGFVANSFYSGLEPPEFFFHAMGGREGLVDTSVKTAETGYMQRCLIKALEDLSLKYDLTVRTSAGDVVQFAFGDDGLNPARMECSNSKPLDFEYLIRHVLSTMRPRRGGKDSRAGTGGPRAKRRRLAAGSAAAEGPGPGEQGGAEESVDPLMRPLLPSELLTLAGPSGERFSAAVRRTHGSAELDVAYIAKDLTDFIKGLAKKVVAQRLQLCLEPADTPQSASAARVKDRREDIAALSDSGVCPTRRHLDTFIDRCTEKYIQAMLSPGEAVGVVAAQSIGEPATQMTLKTFHFAGVASMNVTLGVPRIKEIINATKKISTPIITCSLLDERSEVSARIIKGRIEKCTLADITLYIKETYQPAGGCYLSVKLNLENIKKLQLEVTVHDVVEALTMPKALPGLNRLPRENIEVRDDSKFLVRPQVAAGASSKMFFFALQELKSALPYAVVHGVRSTLRAIINKDDKDKSKIRYNILVEGLGLKTVMNIPGVHAKTTTSNHVIEVEKVLGIEAARKTIMQEIAYTMGQHGISVDARHVQMLGDCMTYRGAVLGINRFGISKMRTSALMLASFERVTDVIFDAALHQRVDPVKGVSECIILGATINVGTGMHKLLYDYGGKRAPLEAAGQPPPSLARSAAPGAAAAAAPGTAGAAQPVTPASALPASAHSRTPLLGAWRGGGSRR